MRRRLLLTTDVVGGVWDFSIALASAVDAQVTLLALGEPTRIQADQARAAGIRLVAEPLKLEWMLDAETDVLRTRELVARLVRQLRPDLVHANQFAAACADVDVPVVLTLHSDVLSWRRWTLGSSDVAPAWRGYANLVREALASADRVVAVSAFLAAETGQAYGCRREIQVIHNGWPAYPMIASGERARTTLVAGRMWDAAKNLALVTRAVEGWEPGRVFVAGDQTSPESSGRVNIPPALEALGFLSRRDLDAVLSSVRIYLSPARYDPFGLLPLQAALNGCCLLLSDIPSYRELWDGAAVFFRSDDVADLRTHWAQLLDDPARAIDFSRRARQLAADQYSVARMAAAYDGVYASLGAVAV